MALLLLATWGALVLGALWLKAGRHRFGASLAQTPSAEDSRWKGHPPLWALALLSPLCLWLVAAGAAQPRDRALLVTFVALNLIVWLGVLCLAAGGDAPADS